MHARIRLTAASLSWGALALCSIGLMGLLASGCGEMEDTAIASPTSAETAINAIPQGFSLSDLPADLHLSAEQSDAMGSAIDHLKNARHARRELARGTATPPMFEFLEESSRVLSPDQFVILARFLNERRESQKAHFGDAMRARMGERWAKRHGVSDAEREQALSRMTPEERTKRDQMRGERMASRIEQRLETLPAAMERRADFLGRVLGLDAGQTNQVRTILLDSVSARRATLEQLRAGSIQPRDAASSARVAEREIDEKVRALLTPEQTTRFDAIESLLPKGLRMRGAMHR